MTDGIISVYKEQGYTSHDVVAKMRGIFKQKKIGHTGTLDPMAEGVLPVCLGRATKLCDMLTDKTKTYRAVLLLGVCTDTQDTTGKILRECAVEVSKEQVIEAVSSFLGEYDQIPPMYSAIKVDGKKLYQLAREGKEIERRARRVEILEIKVEEIHLPRVTMTVSCSKGTYIRTLCQDIGEKLGCCGCMESLLRIRVSEFRLEESLKLEEIERLKAEDKLAPYIIPVEEMFLQYPAVSVKAEFDHLVHNGNPFFPGQAERKIDAGSEIRVCGPARVYDSQGQFIGIYGPDPEAARFKPIKVFLGGD